MKTEDPENDFLRIGALNELIRINNDRISGYKRAVGACADSDLLTLFNSFIQTSRLNEIELHNLVEQIGGRPADGSTSLAGKFYRAWIDLKTELRTSTRMTVLDYCNHGDQIALKAYFNILDDRDFNIDNEEIIQNLHNQQQQLILENNQLQMLKAL